MLESRNLFAHAPNARPDEKRQTRLLVCTHARVWETKSFYNFSFAQFFLFLLPPRHFDLTPRSRYNPTPSQEMWVLSKTTNMHIYPGSVVAAVATANLDALRREVINGPATLPGALSGIWGGGAARIPCPGRNAVRFSGYRPRFCYRVIVACPTYSAVLSAAPPGFSGVSLIVQSYNHHIRLSVKAASSIIGKFRPAVWLAERWEGRE